VADLASWNDTPTRAAIVSFVESARDVPEEERVAVFDNDGTLWCEKPMPIQADFVLRRLHELAAADPALRERQPWQAAYAGDFGWFGRVLEEHYAGDDTNVRTLAAGNSNGDVQMLEWASGCSCCTTTPSASSTTPPAPTGRSSGHAPRAGRW
jgi:hypothetical protein